MIEYLHNAIRAMAGADIIIEAKVSKENGSAITTGCRLVLHTPDEKMLIAVNGDYVGEVWQFIIPAEVTKGLKGRHWYCIQYNENPLCFKEPLYLV